MATENHVRCKNKTANTFCNTMQNADQQTAKKEKTKHRRTSQTET